MTDSDDSDHTRKPPEPDDAAARILREIDDINDVFRRTLGGGSEMGRGPRIVPGSPDPRTLPPPGWDIGYPGDGGPPVVVPPEGDPRLDAVERILAEKRERIRQELEALGRERELAERDAKLTKPTERDAPAKEREVPVIRREPVRYDSPERRQALAARRALLGIAEPVSKAVELGLLGQAKPPTDAVKEPPKPRGGQNEQQQALAREIEAREREERGRDTW